MVHTGDKSKVTSCGSNQSFSKASFVSSTADNASNNISIDDPEFWSKVVGLAVANDEIEGSRKRKCRTFEISYKEPGMSEYLLKGDEEKSTRRRKSDSDSDAEEEGEAPAVWNEANMSKLQSSMLSKGYCQWNTVRADAKLRWSTRDVSKGCRYMLLQLLVQISLHTAATTDATIEAGGSSPGAATHSSIDIDELESHIRKFKCFRLALCAASNDFVPIQVDGKSTNAMDIAGDSTSLTDEYTLLLESLQRFSSTSSEETSAPNIHYFDIGNDLNGARAVEILKQIGVHTESLASDSIPKSKQAAHTKVRQIEDLFELFLAAGHAHQGGEWKEAAAAPSATEATDTEAMVIEPVASTTTNTVLLPYLQALSAVEDQPVEEMEEGAVASDKAVSLTVDFDILLINAVTLHGWPDGKRKINSIMEYFEKQNKLEEFKAASMDDPKVIVKHARGLAMRLRGERKEASKSSAASDANRMKKNINTVIRTIQRIGRPRAMYEAMASTVVLADGDNVLKTRSYLLTWDQFMAEVNCSDLPLEKCKEIVAAIVDTHGIATAKTSTDSEKIVTEGLLAGISLKQMELCHEKCDVLHRLRLAVTWNEESRILQFIQRNCKGTGPDAHPSRRDITMPVWWTKHHDLHLLRLVLEQGLGQWKNLAVNNVVSSSLPNFVMPTRVQGVEWSLALTAKNVEKRFNDLYKTLQNSIQVDQLPPGSPSDSLTKAKVAKPFFASSSSTKPPQPSVSQPSVPVTATQPSVPVTATQPSVPVTATQPSVPVTGTDEIGRAHV